MSFLLGHHPKSKFLAFTFLLSWVSLPASYAVSMAGGVETSKVRPAGVPLPATLAKAEALAHDMAQALGGDKTLPSEITAIAAESKAVWAKRADGAWVAPSTVRPGLDVLTLTVVSKAGGSFLRLDFPTDGSLPSGGPGQANNGNAVIGEIEIEAGGKQVKAQVYSSVSQSLGGRDAAAAFDGIKQQGDKGWEAEGSGFETGIGKPAQLIAQLETPLAAGVPVTVRIIAKTKWGQHVPGCVSAAVVGGSRADALAVRIKAMQGEFDAWRNGVAGQLQAILATDAKGGGLRSPSREDHAKTGKGYLKSVGVEEIAQAKTLTETSHR